MLHYQIQQAVVALRTIKPQQQVVKLLLQADIRKKAQPHISQAHHQTLRLIVRLITTMRLKQL